MKKILLVLPLVLMLGMVLMTAVSSAQVLTPPPSETTYGSESGFFLLMKRIINILFTVLMILAVLFIMWAAFKYLTAGGNAEKVQEAGKMVLYAVVAIAIALLARAVPPLVCSILNLTCTLPAI